MVLGLRLNQGNVNECLVKNPVKESFYEKIKKKKQLMF